MALSLLQSAALWRCCWASSGLLLAMGFDFMRQCNAKEVTVQHLLQAGAMIFVLLLGLDRRCFDVQLQAQVVETPLMLTAAGSSVVKQSAVVPVQDCVQNSIHLYCNISCAPLPAGSSALGLLLGPEGDFVREMLIEELAKGVDAALRTTLDDAIAGTRERLMQLLGVSAAEGVGCSGRARG